MSVPSFLLKKLYVKGSLKNTADGFEFALKNNLAPGSLIGLGPITLDGADIAPAAITMKSAQGQVRGDQISSRSPVLFGMNVEAKIFVQGPQLAPGAHHVVVAVMTREIGRIEIDLTDNV
jgi:hydroxymethylglutaryl-CoA reductase (NADPH)